MYELVDPNIWRIIFLMAGLGLKEKCAVLMRVSKFFNRMLRRDPRAWDKVMHLHANRSSAAAVNFIPPQALRSLSAARVSTRVVIANPFFTDDHVQAVAQYPNLATLSLNNCWRVTDQALTGHLRGHRRLATLDLSGCAVTDEGLGALPSLNGLKTLLLDSVYELTDVGLRHICRITGLVYLSLSENRNITGKGLEVLRELKSLAVLNLSNCTQLADTDLVHLQSFSPSLTSLDLSDCSALPGDKGVAAIANLSRLKTLKLSSCGRISGKDLRLIGTRLPELVHLNLSYCNSVEAEGLRHLGLLTRLQTLNLSGCGTLTDRAVAALVARRDDGPEEQPLPALLQLRLRFCKMLSDASLHRLSRITSLVSLDLTGVDSITGAGLASLCRLANLRFLSLRYCHHLTDADIAAFVPSMARLRILNLAHCPRITGYWATTAWQQAPAAGDSPRRNFAHNLNLETEYSP
jgi:hypothetical protein